MTDLHPEELIARAALGRLDVEQRRRVRAHLRECESCRLELMVRRAAAQDTRPEPPDGRRIVRLAAGAVARARVQGQGVVTPRFGMWTGVALGAVAGIVLMSSVSWAFRFGRASEHSPSPTAVQAPLLREAPTPATSSPGKAIRRPRQTESSVSGAEPSPAPIPVPPAPVLHRPTVEQTSDARSAVSRPAIPERTPVDASPTAATATELFTRATEASREHRTEAALLAFAELRRRFPRSREASTSWVLSGRLLLQGSDAQAALDCFDHYLGASGSASLVPEAMLGRAQALRELDRDTEARDQWQAIERRFPRSSAAVKARSRLEREVSP